MKLDHWCLVARSSPAFLPPEQERSCLHGFVKGHPRCTDGKEVTTSLVVSRRGGKVVTKSGSEYELGEVDPLYEDFFPQARERLLGRLDRVVPVLDTIYEI